MKKGITIAEARSLADTQVRARWRTTTYRSWRDRHRWYHHLPFFSTPDHNAFKGERHDHEAVGYFTVTGPHDMSITMTMLGITGPTFCHPSLDVAEDDETGFKFVEWEVAEPDTGAEA